MKYDRNLWEAAGMVGEDLLAEAEAYVPRRKKRPGVRILAAAAAAVMAVSCLGWAAKEWIFAPGVGLTGIDMLNSRQVYMTTEPVRIGMVELEAVILTEDRENPENNVLTLWAYRQKEDASPVEETDIHFPESDFTALVNGIPYRRSSGITGEWGYQYINLSPAEIPELLGEDCSVILQYPEGEGEIQLQPVNGGDAYQNVLETGMTMILLPLTENLYAGSFMNPAWQKTLERLDLYSVSTDILFSTITKTGKEGLASGSASLNGFEISGGHCIAVMDEYHDQGIASMSLETVDVYLTMGTTGERFSFTLPEVGETLPCEILLWDDMGFTCRLIAVTRTADGLEYSLERTADNEHISEIGVGLEANSGKPYYYQNVVQCHADGTFVIRHVYSLTPEEIPAGTEMTLRLTNIQFCFTNPDGSPLTTFTFD